MQPTKTINSKKAKLLQISVMCTALICFLMSCEKKSAIDSPELVARVNGLAVTVKDYHAALFAEYGSLTIKNDPNYPAIKAQTLKKLVRDAAIFGLAEKKGIAVSDADVDKEIERLTKGQGRKTFEATLLNNNISLEDWREQLKKNLLRDKAFEIVEPEKNQISEKELREYYDTHKGEFSHPERVLVQQIVLNSQEDAEAVRDDLTRKRASFEELAKSRSLGPEGKNGGFIRFEKGVMPDVFDSALFSLKPDRISQVIQTEYGFHILKLVSREPAKQASFEEATKEIKRRLLLNNREIHFARWVESLLKTSNTQYNRKVIEQL